MLVGAMSCSPWKQIPATMSGFEKGKGSIKGPITQQELNQLKVSIISDVNEVIITPLTDNTQTSYNKDGGILRVPKVKIKNIFTFTTPNIWKIVNTNFYKGEEYPDKVYILYVKDSIALSLPFILNLKSGKYTLNTEKKIKEKHFVVKTKNGATVPVLIFNEYGKKVPKITRTTFYKKGPYGYIFISPVDGKKYQINTKNLNLNNIWIKNKKQKIKKIEIEGYKKPK